MAYYSVNDIIGIFFKSIELLIILRIIMSFVPIGRGSDFAEFVVDFTEPILKPFRIGLGAGNGMSFDLSPIFAMIVLNYLEILVLNIAAMLF